LKKILLLGGAYGQLPAIREAKKRGFFTILCDYLSNNPGRELADKFYLVSTVDKDKVLEVAEDNQIDFILAYGSDPAVLTAEFVRQKMEMKGNSIESIEKLTHKDLFRKFQKKNQFFAPDFIVLREKNKIPIGKIKKLLPAVVKPVDSSDTKGVSLIENLSQLDRAVEAAFNHSRCKRVIIEKKVDCEQERLHGDGFVIDGELLFCELGDHIYTSLSDPLKPSSTLYPSRLEKSIIHQVKDETSKLIKKSGFKNGPVNIEARINTEGNIYIMEVGPRNGGNYTPQTIYHSTGFDMVKALYDFLLNKEINIPELERKPAICFTIHSNSFGIFDSYEIDKDLAPFVAEKHIYKKPGDKIEPYKKPASTIGVIIFHFDSMKETNEYLSQLYEKVIKGVRLKDLN
jgi:carbamoylphosphate synthase large subunit